ncbi:MAG: DUF4279 domain-containing protein [Mesorhizobium sp.]|nr:MAG: DUF4279 domain-containing protein [Mesorhizobium sp.]TIO25817.1 MAG: DUF4279 domain-containing protein [Mesorhizobium sp.]TJV62451.1 MAG: DUF4279 domain-containing protein [Mesorhizobium sp.]
MEQAMTRITSFLSIRSETLTPADISELLAMKPDREVIKGSLRTPPRPRPPKHGWNISCRFDDYVDLDVAIKELMLKLDGKFGSVVRLARQENDVNVSVKIAIAPESELVPMFFSAETIGLLGDIGASLDIEYFPE